MLDNAVITIRNYERSISIDVMRNMIECHNDDRYDDITPVIKMTFNQSHVLKFNKTSISTCSPEYLAYAIENSEHAFNAVYMYLRVNNLVTENIKKFNNEYAITKPAFYQSIDVNMLVPFFQGLTSDSKKMFLLDHICYNHDAKMKGIISMSTYVGYNRFCVARCNNCDNAICKYCYANSLTNQRYNLKMKLIRLHIVLTNIELTAADIPVIDSSLYPYFRFESFGDLNNTTQVRNYNLIASVNSDINFTLWTKNPGIIQKAIDNGMTLANNLVIGSSSLYLNTPEIDKAKRYSFIRFLFTVYDDEYIEKHNIVINCGARHCITCGICYKALHDNKNGGLVIINERKK